MIYVSHRLDEISGLVDRVTVLRDGKSMGTFPAVEIDRRKIVSLITGHDTLPTRLRQSASHDEKPLLLTKQLSRKGEFEDISIDLRRGEIVVITGLIGSGRTELLGDSLSRQAARQRRDFLRWPQIQLGLSSKRDPRWNCSDPRGPTGARTLHDLADVRKHSDGDHATLPWCAWPIATVRNPTRGHDNSRLAYQAC